MSDLMLTSFLNPRRLRDSAVHVLVMFAMVAACRAEDLRKYGAVYDDASPAAIAKNDAAVLALQSRLPLSGGTIELRPGVLHVSKTIKNPTRWQYPPGSPGWCPINFGVVGNIVSSRIVMHDVTPSDTSDNFLFVLAPTTPALYPDQGLRLTLSGFTLEGGGVSLVAGGKFSALSDLRITGADTGLEVRAHDGGCFRDIYITRCKTGARFDTSMLNQFNRFTIRECGDGLVVKNCMAWSGQIYLESNIGWQGDFDRLQGSNLSLWLEDHGRGPFRPLVRRRNCFGNIFSGQTQGEQVWDDDPISAAKCRTITAEGEFPDVGQPVGAAKDFAVYAGGPLFTSDGTGLTAICAAGCFGRPQQMYGEIRGFDPTFTHAWKAGDYLEVECDVVCDEATRKFCGSGLPFVLNTAGGSFPVCKQNVRIMGERTHVSFRGPAPSDGKGVRLFCFLLGPTLPANIEEVRFKFERLTVRHLDNQVGN